MLDGSKDKQAVGEKARKKITRHGDTEIPTLGLKEMLLHNNPITFSFSRIVDMFDDVSENKPGVFCEVRHCTESRHRSQSIERSLEKASPQPGLPFCWRLRRSNLSFSGCLNRDTEKVLFLF